MNLIEIVWKRKDGTFRHVADVTDLNEANRILSSSKYNGTWISDSKKVLRHGQGVIILREKAREPRVVLATPIEFDNYKAYELTIVNDERLKRIRIDSHSITGFADGFTRLWTTSSFTELSEIVGKDTAYACFRYYEEYCTAFNIAGAI